MTPPGYRKTLISFSYRYGNQVKLAGIIYMHRISDNRMTEGIPFRNSKTFAQMCGTSAADRLVLVTTMWACVPPDVGKRREEGLKNNCWKGLLEKNAKVARFDANFESAQNIIRSVYEPARGSVDLQQANHDQPTSMHRGLQKRGSSDIKPTPSYTPTAILVHNEPPPSSTQSRGEMMHADAAAASCLPEIPDEDDFQTGDERGDERGDETPSISPTSHQGGELHGYSSTAGYTRTEVETCLPHISHVIDWRVEEVLPDVARHYKRNFQGRREEYASVSR